MKLDCKDLDCPKPVLRVKEALDSMEEGILDVELNSLSSIENVKRFVNSRGLYFEEKKIAPRYVILSIVKGYECSIDLGDTDKDKEAKDRIEASAQALRASQIVDKAKEKRDARKFYSLMFGGIISAILASTCCLGPLLFLIFGVSVGSLSFLQKFAPYHNYFSIGAITVVSYLWFDWFRDRKDRVACATSLCKNYTLYLTLGTIFVAILVTYPWWVVYLLPSDDF